MSRKTSFSITSLALAAAVFASLPASAQKIIAVQIKVDNLTARSSVQYALGDPVPVNVGDRVRVNLIGTAIVNGTGVSAPVNARFGIGAGRENISLGQAGPNSVVVDVRGRSGDGRAQVTYNADAKYDMAHNRDGRITFEIGGGAPATGGPGPVTGPGGQDSDRRGKAVRLTSVLYRAILNADASGPQFDQDVNRVYQAGYRGVHDVATALANQAERSGMGRSRSDRGYQQADSIRVGDLYRQLLKRTDGYQALWDRDPGFRGNVNALHEKGLVAVVQSLVGSEEFVNAQGLGRFDPI